MKKILNYLVKNNLTISFVESITGGMLAYSFIKNKGASNAIKESFILYSNETKIKRLGIDPKIINKYGVVSNETAYQMALKLRELTSADITVSTTGYASGKSPNMAFIGINIKGNITTFEIVFDNKNSRVKNIKLVINKVREILNNLI